ncbi:MAG: adenosine deaminase [Thermoanaerobaculia bacterium]|nr:adenosine deaminase [Thermoanaerobaculia bacterium]
MTAADLDTFCRELPKIELHVHLEGSIRPRTLLTLARRRGVELPADDEAGLARWFAFRDFDHFVDIYLTCSRCLRDPEDFQLVVRDFLAEQARQNVLHSEVHFTIGTHLANGVAGDEVADAVWQGIEAGERELGVSMRLIPDIVRNADMSHADATVEWALESRRFGVVALGLSGSEEWPTEPFREHFAAARQEGLHVVAHAGEQAGPASIRSALAVCGPERIGHGISAVEDPTLLAELAEAGIPLEICPTSNVALGFVESVEAHPFDRLRRAGVPLSVNSDDPPFFGTTLSDEYRRLAEAFGYDRSTLAELARAALEQSFVGPARRRELAERAASGAAALGVEYHA